MTRHAKQKGSWRKLQKNAKLAFGSVAKRRALMVNVAIVVVGMALGMSLRAYAEQAGSSPTNSQTSRLVTLYNTLSSSGYGSDTDTPNRGAYVNRINTAALFSSGATATPADVASGKTFFANSRTLQTGTNTDTPGLFVGPCPTQAYHDSYGAPVTQTTNCTNNVTWTTADPAVTGDDKQDPRSGLVWSQALLNSAGTVTFTTSTPSTWTWGATGTNNVAVGNKTASQLCSDRGNGWRLPTQKELMQAYIDGSYFNLSQPSSYFWSATENSSTFAWGVGLGIGGASSGTKASSYYVRCVR